ncbi:MAG: glycosyltransferase [Candidatus Aenigmarchaeota archaeon]|nr:glycosyltransferase [Candidatus Aenigmarchaeota archaeon]
MVRVNFIVEGMGLARGSGVYSAASRLASFLRDEGVDVDINGRGYTYDIMHSHTPLLFSLMKLRKAKKHGVKIITHAHTTAEDAKGSWTLTESDSVLNMVGKYLTFFYNNADLVLTPSQWTKETLMKRHVVKPIRVISNGIDREIFRFSRAGRKQFRDHYGITGTETVVYCVGLIYIRKGIEQFVEVARRFPGVRFVWIGKRYPSFFIGFSKIAKILNGMPDNVHLLGYVDDIVAAHSGCDALFFPSYVENQGITVLEALACGRPVVVRDLPSYRSWGFVHGQDCMMGSSVDNFTVHIENVIRDAKLRSRLARNGSRHAERHDIRHVAAELAEIYETLAD